MCGSLDKLGIYERHPTWMKIRKIVEVIACLFLINQVKNAPEIADSDRIGGHL